ncbi:Uncharacterised protein [Vibrio cholerae]|nr:Uncharacterised protein [Vibrio cholerae]CSC74693.1 Uncharacterised protein [Vibrio cholerae]
MMRVGSSVNQGSKRFWISSPIGERGTSTRESTKNSRPQNHALLVRYATGVRSLMRLITRSTTRKRSLLVKRELSTCGGTSIGR